MIALENGFFSRLDYANNIVFLPEARTFLPELSCPSQRQTAEADSQAK